MSYIVLDGTNECKILIPDKEKDKNFLPDGAKRLLEDIHAIILGYWKGNNIPPTRFATDAGLNKNSLGVVEEEKYTDKGKRSTIDLFTLVKILNQYPDLKMELGRYLSGNKEEKITPVLIERTREIDPLKRLAFIEQELDELRRKADNLEDKVQRLEKKKPAAGPAKN